MEKTGRPHELLLLTSQHCSQGLGRRLGVLRIENGRLRPSLGKITIGLVGTDFRDLPKKFPQRMLIPTRWQRSKTAEAGYPFHCFDGFA
jgi:hypothetical protein